MYKRKPGRQDEYKLPTIILAYYDKMKEWSHDPIILRQTIFQNYFARCIIFTYR
jgi:hypothetical protein